MNIKDRLSKADDRIVVMVRKYPVVFTILALGFGLLGFVLGAWLI